MSDIPLKIIITPNPALVDDEVRIRITGAPPRTLVTIVAWTMDDQNRRWESHAEFMSRLDGTVILSQDAPRSGTYSGVDPAGLFWSMRLNPGDAGQNDQYLKKELEPSEITFEATTPDMLHTARERLEKQFVPQGTIVRAVEEEGLAGLLFLPSGEAREQEYFDADGTPRAVTQSLLSASKKSPAGGAIEDERLPVVITLGGSGGGLDWEVAAALAGHGYAGFALPYFGFDPLPPSLNSIPLEYFERAIAWLCRQPEIDPNRIAVYGISRGAELALLLASKIPLLRVVIGMVPGHVTWQGTGRAPEDGKSPSVRGNGARSSWTYRGEQIPFVPYAMSWFRIWTAVRVITFRKAVRFLDLHHDSLRQRHFVELAGIPVEHIRAPILLVSASDDAVWPSEAMAEAAVRRLQARGFEYEALHVKNPDAGHLLRLPHTPATTVASKVPTFDLRVAFGGKPQATAQARVVAWRETLKFLQRHL
jgi:dienelactone hydrolase